MWLGCRVWREGFVEGFGVLYGEMWVKVWLDDICILERLFWEIRRDLNTFVF